MKRMNFRNRKEVRRAEAEKRDADRAKRSPHEQLAILDKKLGNGVGAKKERTLLNKLISK